MATRDGLSRDRCVAEALRPDGGQRHAGATREAVGANALCQRAITLSLERGMSTDAELRCA
jgi:hypothetical protein